MPSRGSVLIGLLVFAAAVGAFAVARETSLFAVRTIEVRGGSPAVQREVAKALAGEQGVSLVRIDGDRIADAVAAVPWAAATTFDRAFPHTLVVTVKPERPVAVARRGARSWLLSARGRVLMELPRRARPRLPRIWVGPRTRAPAVGAVLGDAAGGDAARALAPLAGVRFPARVASVKSSDDELTFVLRSGLELRLGDPGDLRLKLAIARRILPTLATAAPGAYVDVSVPERPVASGNPQVEG